jgi:hypothetical protein
MKQFILVWTVNDYPDNGGGTEYELYDNIQQVTNKVNELAQDKRMAVAFCGHLRDEVKFKPVEKITLWEVDD